MDSPTPPKGSCNCKEFIEQLDLLLDSECNKADQARYIEHVNNCKGCLEVYDVEKSFKQFVSLKAKDHPVPQNLIENIRSRISKEDPGRT